MRSSLRIALLCSGLAAGCHGQETRANVTVAVADQVTTVKIVFGPAAGAVAEYPENAVPPGTEVTLTFGTAPELAGFLPAGQAYRVDFTAKLSAPGEITIPYNPCILRSFGASAADLVVLVETGGVVTELSGPAVNADNTVTFDLDVSATFVAAIPDAPLRCFQPLCGMGASGIALGTDGTAFTWGSNVNGQLGDGTNVSTRSPAPVPDLSGAVSVDAGVDFSVALLADGTVVAWGSNARGQLGDGTFLDSPTPVVAADLPCIVRIAVGATSRTVLAEAHDGTLWAWGSNSQGQVGNGTTTDQGVPFQVPGIVSPRDFAVTTHSLAVCEDGTVMAWGANAVGQLGLGTQRKELEPTPVPDLEDIIAAACGADFSLAVTDGGSVLSWGGDEFGQLGTGLVDQPRSVPGSTLVLSGIVAVDATAFSGIALQRGGDVFTWGRGSRGQIGDGNDLELQAVPLRVLALSEVIDVDGGPATVIAALDDGTYATWGFNGNGEVGDGTLIPRLMPGMLDGVSKP